MVRRLSVLAAMVVFVPLATARVWVQVYRCDEVTPLAAVDGDHPKVYRDIMVGTRLAIVVGSDYLESWTGALLLSWDDANDATLTGRGYVPSPPGVYSGNYKGSRLDAAGTAAEAFDHIGPDGIGFEFSNDVAPYITGGHPAYAGDWFIFDYRAQQVGRCDVGLYERFPRFGASLEALSFTHVAAREFNGDGIVDFRDFASLAARWRSPVDPSSADAALDLNADLQIDSGDLARFVEYWLERTDCNPAAADAGK